MNAYRIAALGVPVFMGMIAQESQAQYVHLEAYTISGANYNSLGLTVSTAGDVDNDGYDDVIIGAARDDKAGGGNDHGSARVISGYDGSELYKFWGDGNLDNFGTAVAGAGDVDGDGYDDLVVGAPEDDNNGTRSGMARVFSGYDGSVLYTFDGDSAGDRFGFSVAGAGDVDNDGYDDVIVGAPADDNNGTNSGSARVFSGYDGSVIYTLNGDSGAGTGEFNGDYFGVSVAGGADFDGDAYADFVVGAKFDDNNGADSGSARCFSGYDGSTIETLDGDAAGDNFGDCVGIAGDFDGDSKDDVIVGAPLHTPGATSYAGAFYVYSTTDGGILEMSGTGVAVGAFMGFKSLSGVGDYDGDGNPDVIVGAYNEADGSDRPGVATVFTAGSGTSAIIVDEWIGSHDGSQFGYAVSGAGDLNGDGIGDLVVGAPDSFASSNPGIAHIYVSTQGYCEGDANADGVVNFADLDYVGNRWGNSGAPGIPGDVNVDGQVDSDDSQFVLDNLGTCP